MVTDTTTFPWLSLLVATPLFASVLLAILKPKAQLVKVIALAVSALVLVLTVVMLVTEFSFGNAASLQLTESYSWISSLGVSIAWGLNGMSAVMFLLAAILVPVVLIAAWEDFSEAKTGGYFAWILALESIMLGLFAAQDLFLFYVLFEAMIVPMYFLIGRYGGEGRERAAMKFLLYSLFGGLVMLIGVIAVYFGTQGGPTAYLYSTIAGNSFTPTVQMWLFVSFFIAFAIKAPMWPVHTWLPDTTEKAPAGTSTLLVGVLDKLGTYGMIAICLPFFPVAAAKAAPFIMALAIVSIFWGALMAIGSDNMMRLIAYTSVSHFGFMVLGIFSGSELAISGAILYMVAHGVGTAALFLIVDFLGKRGNSHLISQYGGWQRVTPLIAGSFMIAGLATIALPGLSGFVPEYLVLVGTFQVSKAAAIISVIGVVLAALYILLPYQRVFTGPKPNVEVADLNLREKLVMGILIALMLVLGFYPAPILELVSGISEATAQLFTAGATT
ncbi:MAG: NADH-quinone oxidoreductase subunit M, partial [Arcanobacterium sp.]|nr:NADH-quinone oxidoreductase subunit M [Arcanobacterium sp.]